MSGGDSTCDVLICGGAIIGSAIAWFLSHDKEFTGSIIVADRDPTYVTAATALSASGIRQQFSNTLNVEISQFGVEFIRSAPKIMGTDLHFHERGYLYLASTDAQMQIMRENHRTQQAAGSLITLMQPHQVRLRFPDLNVTDILLASFGQTGEGWFDNMGLLAAFRAGAKSSGVQYVTGEVAALTHSAGRIESAQLSNGTIINCGQFVNCAGTHAAKIADMAGLDLPVEPRKRTNFLFSTEKQPQSILPLIIDPNGVWCRPEGSNFLCGCTPLEDPAVDPADFAPRHEEFDDIIWPTLAHRSQLFEAVKVRRFWAGHYDFNNFDQNAVIGPHPAIANFLFANGFSGHGLQQAPAIGRGIAEWITYGAYRSLDLTELGYQRIAAGRPFLERNVI